MNTNITQQIEAVVTELGYSTGTSGDPNAGWPRAEGIAVSVRPEYSFGDGISAVAVTPTFVQKWFRPYPWGHTDWRPVGAAIHYTSKEELAKALASTVKLNTGMWNQNPTGGQ